VTVSPLRSRIAAVLLAAVVALGSGGCLPAKPDRNGASTKASEPTAWEKVMAMTGPDGEVSTAMALSAFATAFVPLPGVGPQPGSLADLKSGSTALRWITGHWSDITPEQRAVVGAVLGQDRLPGRREPGEPPAGQPPSGRPRVGPRAHPGTDSGTDSGTGAGSKGTGAADTTPGVLPDPASCPADSTPDPVYAAKLRGWWNLLAPKVAITGPPGLAACRSKGAFTPTSGANKGTAQPQTPSSAWGWNNPTGPQCQVLLYPRFRSAAIPDAQREELLIHELAHCVEGIVLDDTNAYAAMPDWVSEGLAEWMSGKLSGHYTNTGIWQSYLTRQSRTLTNQAYSAVGFWWELDHRGVDVWARARPAIAASASGTSRRDAAAFAAALGDRRQDVLEGWASSYLRDRARELAWDTDGIAITPDRPAPGRATSVGNNEAVEITGLPFDPTLAAVDLGAEVVRLAPGAGAPPFGRFGPGPGGDYPLTAHLGDVFCTLGAQRCTCPKDTPGEGTTFVPIPAGHGYTAVTGGELRASVKLTGQSLVDFCGPKKPQPPPPSGGGCSGGCAIGSSNGDPHLRTFDDLPYDFQAAGEFTLAASLDGELLVQTRQQPFPGSTKVGVTTAVAANALGDRVGFHLDPTNGGIEVHLGGRTIAPTADTVLAHGGRLLKTGEAENAGYEVRLPDGSTLSVTPIGNYGLKVDLAVPTTRAGRMSGLLGNADGDPGNDFDAGGGRILAGSASGLPAFGELYGEYADHWRVTPQTSLFDYAPGQSTATFTDRTFAREPTDSAPVPGTERARALCESAGVTDAAVLAGCILDVVATGRDEFVAAAAAQQRSLTAHPPTGPPGNLGGDASCRPGGEDRIVCAGTIDPAQPARTVRFFAAHYVKLSFSAAGGGSGCDVRYAVFRDGAADPVLDYRSVCAPQAADVPTERTDYTIRFRGVDPSASTSYGLIVGGTA
jgi:hypothetical protein